MASILEEREQLARIADKQKAQAMSMIERLLRSQVGTMARMALSAWVFIVKERSKEGDMEGAFKKSEEELRGIRREMKEMQKQRRDAARNVLHRVTRSCSSGLLSTMFGIWIRGWQGAQQ